MYIYMYKSFLALSGFVRLGVHFAMSDQDVDLLASAVVAGMVMGAPV